MYERRTKPLLPRKQFAKRMAKTILMAVALILVSLGIGMAGYHGFEKLSWLDSFENAAMILSGMGPVSPINTDAGKIFAGCYALYSGLALISTLAIVIAPVFHRFLHKFHLSEDK